MRAVGVWARYRFRHTTGGVTCDFTDATVDICMLNTVPVGSSISLAVATEISADGAPQPTFSVTPQGRSGRFE
jgi:hypothetical protein